MPKPQIKKKVVKFRTPRTCTKTRDIPGCRSLNYPLLEEWEVALDDLCDLMIQAKNARDFLKRWSALEPRDYSADCPEEWRAIAARRIERALDYLLHAENELEGAWVMTQEIAFDRYRKETREEKALTLEWHDKLLKEEDYESAKRGRRRR